jgi:hypothetical protein
MVDESCLAVNEDGASREAIFVLLFTKGMREGVILEVRTYTGSGGRRHRDSAHHRSGSGRWRPRLSWQALESSLSF